MKNKIITQYTKAHIINLKSGSKNIFFFDV